MRRSPEGKLHSGLWQGPGHGSTLSLASGVLSLKTDCVMTNLTGFSPQP